METTLYNISLYRFLMALVRKLNNPSEKRLLFSNNEEAHELLDSLDMLRPDFGMTWKPFRDKSGRSYLREDGREFKKAVLRYSAKSERLVNIQLWLYARRVIIDYIKANASPGMVAEADEFYDYPYEPSFTDYGRPVVDQKGELVMKLRFHIKAK